MKYYDNIQFKYVHQAGKILEIFSFFDTHKKVKKENRKYQ